MIETNTINCWDIMKCGNKKDSCSAYPDNGLDCWKVTGTMCSGLNMKSVAEKIVYCRGCKFYKQYAIKF